MKFLYGVISKINNLSISFRILIISDQAGLVETIRNAISVHSIKKEGYESKTADSDVGYSLYDYYIKVVYDRFSSRPLGVLAVKSFDEHRTVSLKAWHLILLFVIYCKLKTGNGVSYLLDIMAIFWLIIMVILFISILDSCLQILLAHSALSWHPLNFLKIILIF